MTKPIATIGTDNDFVELFMQQVAGKVKLHARATHYKPIGGETFFTDISMQTVDEEDAVNVAVDMQYEAQNFLEAECVSRQDWYKDGLGFGEAVEKALE